MFTVRSQPWHPDARRAQKTHLKLCLVPKTVTHARSIPSTSAQVPLPEQIVTAAQGKPSPLRHLPLLLADKLLALTSGMAERMLLLTAMALLPPQLRAAPAVGT